MIEWLIDVVHLSACACWLYSIPIFARSFSLPTDIDLHIYHPVVLWPAASLHHPFLLVLTWCIISELLNIIQLLLLKPPILVLVSSTLHLCLLKIHFGRLASHFHCFESNLKHSYCLQSSFAGYNPMISHVYFSKSNFHCYYPCLLLWIQCLMGFFPFYCWESNVYWW